MTDLWTMAGEEAEREAAEHHLALARVACARYWPVLARAASKDDYDHAKALVSEGVTAAVADIATSPADQAILASRVLDSFDEDWEKHRTAVVENAPAYAEQMGFAFPVQPLPNEAPELENEIAAWEGTDQQTRVNSGNGIGVADETSGPNVAGPGANPGQPPVLHAKLLHASALDIEAGLEPGDYRLDAFGALIPVEASPWSHLRNADPSGLSDQDLENHLLLHHHQMSAPNNRADMDQRHMDLHGNPGVFGYAGHDHGGGRDPDTQGVIDSMYRIFGTRHTAPGGGEHAPYYIREEGGKFKVVNRNGEVKGTHDTKEQARQQQKALYVNVPGATEEAEKRHGHTPKAVSEKGKKATLQTTAGTKCRKCGADLEGKSKQQNLLGGGTKLNWGACPKGGSHEPTTTKEESLQLTALQRQAVAVARKLVDDMPQGVQHHAVAKAMWMRAKGFDLSEDETDLVINAALGRCSERLQMQADGVPQSKRDRAEEAGHTLPGTDKFPIENKSDLEKAKHDIGRTNEPHDKVVRYINQRAEDLGGEKVGEDKSEKTSRLARLWHRVTGRQVEAQGTMNPAQMANPMNPSSVANPFSPAQDVNAAMTDTNPTMSGMAAGAGGIMSPGTAPPDEIAGQTVPGSATAASSKPRTKPSSNPNAPNKPSPGVSPMGPVGVSPMMAQPGLGQVMTSPAMMAARVAVADTILAANPTLSDEDALHLAAKTIERYPHLVHEAYGGADYPFDDGDRAYGACSQCGVPAFDSRTGHCHHCGYVSVNGTNQAGWDPISGTTTIHPGPAQFQNPGIR